MVSIKQTPDGDIALENFTLHFLSGVESTVQRLKNKFALWKGDWFLNIDAGIPWIQEILGQRPQEQVVATIFRNVIANDPDIEELLSLNFEFDRSTRNLTIRFQAQRISGETINEEFVV